MNFNYSTNFNPANITQLVKFGFKYKCEFAKTKCAKAKVAKAKIAKAKFAKANVAKAEFANTCQS